MVAAIDLSALQSLIDQPREALDIEVKEFLDLTTNEHRALLAKEVIALGNHGGGYLIIGLCEQADGTFEFDSKQVDLNKWSQDGVQSVIAKYVLPTIQCHATLIKSRAGNLHPVIKVPGGHRSPIRAKSSSPDAKKLVQNRIYVRRPGPASEEPQTAAEWDELFERCILNRQSELIEAMRSILSGALPSAAPQKEDDKLLAFAEGARKRWSCLVRQVPDQAGPKFPYGSYECMFEFPVSQRFSLTEMHDKIQSAMRNHSGWPPFVLINRLPYSPYAQDGAIEAWIGPDGDGTYGSADNSDFWRISPSGKMYTRRGFKEDTWQTLTPGQAFDLGLNIQRAAEAALQAIYLAQALGTSAGPLRCAYKWRGLQGRKLVSIGERPRDLSMNYVSGTDVVEVAGTGDIALLPITLPEVLFSPLSTLFECFSSFKLPKKLVEEEIAALQKHSF